MAALDHNDPKSFEKHTPTVKPPVEKAPATTPTPPATAATPVTPEKVVVKEVVKEVAVSNKHFVTIMAGIALLVLLGIGGIFTTLSNGSKMKELAQANEERLDRSFQAVLEGTGEAVAQAMTPFTDRLAALELKLDDVQVAVSNDTKLVMQRVNAMAALGDYEAISKADTEQACKRLVAAADAKLLGVDGFKAVMVAYGEQKSFPQSLTPLADLCVMRKQYTRADTPDNRVPNDKVSAIPIPMDGGIYRRMALLDN